MNGEISKEFRDILKQLIKSMIALNTPEIQNLSPELIDNAASEFKLLLSQNNKWVASSYISEIFKDVPYNAGKFIIEKFGFTNYFIEGRSTYFNKKDLLLLKNELKKRNIDLALYIHLIKNKERLLKCVENARKRTQKGKPFRLPEGIKDIIPIENEKELPKIELVQKKIESLKKVFKKENMGSYVTLYLDSTFAMYKYELDPDYELSNEKKAKCNKWCKEFNYANHILNMIQYPK